MKIKTRCDNCGKVYNMASEYIGRTAQCKRCGHHFIMNPYDPGAEAFPAPPAAAPRPPQPAAAYTPPPPVFNSQPAMAPAGGQHPMADQTILPNAATAAQGYAPQAAPRPYQQQAQAAPYQQAAPYAPQPDFAARPAPQQQQPLGGRSQTALCLKCGSSFQIPVPTKRMKLTCQTCGAKIAVTPEKQPKGAKAPKAGGSSSKSLLLLLLLILILAGALFVGPMLLPDIFPDLIGGLLG